MSTDSFKQTLVQFSVDFL